MNAQKIQFGMWPGGEDTGTGAPAWRSDPRGAITGSLMWRSR